MENQNYEAVMIHAARVDNVDVISELIKLGVSVNCKDDKGYTPLIIACYNNRLNAVHALLDHGAAIDEADANGNTALMGSCFKGHDAIVKALIDRGCIS